MAKRIEWLSSKKRNFESSISDIVSQTVRPLMDNNSKLQAELILSWKKIFDESLAGKISFKKISFTDKKTNKFILHVTVANKDMLEITYATEIIKEQLAVFLGFKGCEKVVISKA